MLEITIRRATVEDIPTLIEHRCAMFGEMNFGSPQRITDMAIQYERWLNDNIPSDTYRHWWAILDGEICAGAGLGLQPWQPTARDPHLIHAYIDNIYTLPNSRRQGIARQLVQHLLAQSRADGIQVFKLHASADGAHLYRSLGFESTSEMRLNLD